MALWYLFPTRTWSMILHRNVFQSEYFLEDQIQQISPIEVMLVDAVPDSTDTTNPDQFTFLLCLKYDNILEETTLTTTSRLHIEGYTISLKSFSYDKHTQRIVCFLEFRKRRFRY